MRSSNIAYNNLRAEMARANIGVTYIAEACGYNRDTLARKLAKKSAINLDDAFRIQQVVFPGYDVRYLFDLPIDDPQELSSDGESA